MPRSRFAMRRRSAWTSLFPPTSFIPNRIGEADAADDHHEDDVVQQRAVDDAGVHRMDARRHDEPGDEGEQRRPDILEHDHRADRQARIARRVQVVAGQIDIAAILTEAQPQESRGQDRREDHKLNRTGRQARVDEGREQVAAGRQVDDILGQELGPSRVVDEGADRKHREDRGHFKTGASAADRSLVGEPKVDRAHAPSANIQFSSNCCSV
jgi:hypothetical protein